MTHNRSFFSGWLCGTLVGCFFANLLCNNPEENNAPKPSRIEPPRIERVVYLDEDNDGAPELYVKQKDTYYFVDTESEPPRMRVHKTRTPYIGRTADKNRDGWLTSEETDERE